MRYNFYYIAYDVTYDSCCHDTAHNVFQYLLLCDNKNEFYFTN